MAQSPQRWLRGWKIVSRLRLIVAAPLVAVLGFAGLALGTSATQAQRAAVLGDLVALGAEAGDLAFSLQCERADAATMMTVDPSGHLDPFLRQTAITDRAINRFGQLRRELDSAPARIGPILHRIESGFAGLTALRQQVRSATTGAVSAVTFGYRILIADLLAYRAAMAQTGLSEDLVDRLRAAVVLSDAIEYAGQEQVAVISAVAGGQLTRAMQQTITTARTGYTEASLSFLKLAPPDWQVWWDRADSGQEALIAQRLQDRVGRVAPGSEMGLDGIEWEDRTEEWFAQLFTVQQQVDAALLDDVSTARSTQLHEVWLNVAGVTLAVLLTLLVTTAVARQVRRQLHRLREAANTVAFNRLPAVVHELRTAQPGSLRPDEVASRSTTLVRSAFALSQSGTDEISEVAQAFAEVHRAAVRTSAEQAIMRANMAEIFIHLSRRGQRLVDAVLAQVDVVERDETDPDRLRLLYELDNLATRMARINASLLVLGGVGIGRIRSADVPVSKILQAALSQIQHYTRIRFGVVDQNLTVVSEAVDDIVHLFAELMDNATMYSPPDSEAWVTARALGDRVIVQIGDEGVGLPAHRREQLNELLRRPPAVDVATVRSMGLVVVGHLAARLGAHVELRTGPRLGTIAEVTLTSEVFRGLS
ncbi:MAG: sensor histidine kinase, partial [Dactylosporangium sp.]|nr:nitrate- and nitrite sensing domain-containing protein [Dactylosporangium sp.]NNJ60179.1 sensor histidine kinase [Dactylosporangium sp.]